MHEIATPLVLGLEIKNNNVVDSTALIKADVVIFYEGSEYIVIKNSTQV